ncbi:uncharacterized protein FFUJ_11267 [Fusarium fujikuroi IMI 58289]|uniref:T6SS Phospholipase effector Tle1-like catalytic domain-containing protein n=1 Tax=Gibberella fujikuroi (strain CBS 195.34 / IMI 58289 / NRRL A-6831) TaxID=1279085 RepID=S0EKT9_GIBF5|nr:uncharacterized protein FFUJ_11267 [Fusarium fujikuroi IMI 58289]CCT75242.1 uncharacterized protein FFUJ_11267 [Fusarium fujikuroi IMI 58289]SCO25608.1 uncharacterized protein FFM5_14183 [Fusarium fujikuroi]
MVEQSTPALVEITGTAHHVCHAVAVDEHRVKFKPAFFSQDIKTSRRLRELTEKEDIREVWFPGNHGDVGGGWPAIPTGLKIWRLWNCIFGGTKVDNLDESLQDDDLQMSDIALEWMIREVDIVGSVTAHHFSGFLCGISLKLYLAFLSENSTKPQKEEDRGWELYTGMPNWWGRHDTPRGAVLHNSLKELEKADSYRPLNNHGSGEPCLWNSKGVADMRDVTYQRLNQRGQEIKSAVWDSRHKIWQFEDFYAQNAQPRIY